MGHGDGGWAASGRGVRAQTNADTVSAEMGGDRSRPTGGVDDEGDPQGTGLGGQ
jgi:hypothetical protein